MKNSQVEFPNLPLFTLLSLGISQHDLVNNKWCLICRNQHLKVFYLLLSFVLGFPYRPWLFKVFFED